MVNVCVVDVCMFLGAAETQQRDKNRYLPVASLGLLFVLPNGCFF